MKQDLRGYVCDISRRFAKSGRRGHLAMARETTAFTLNYVCAISLNAGELESIYKPR